MTIDVPAQPGPYAFDPETTALVVIDMQRDFLEPGGFGSALGNDVSLLSSADRAAATRPGGRARARDAGHPHARGPPARHGRLPAGEVRARRVHRHRQPEGPDPDPRRVRPRHRGRAGARAGRDRPRQARQGLLLRHRPRADAAQPRHQVADRHRRHHRGLRAHDRARGQRPRLRVPRPRGLLRLLLPRVPRGRPADDRRPGRDLRLGRHLERPSRQPDVEVGV